MKKLTISSLLLLAILSISSCISSYDYDNETFSYPNSKIWKHGVYSEYEAEKYAEVFDGLEVDLVYSKKHGNIFIGRQEDDAEKGHTFDTWISMIKKPNETHYWIDFKNLSTENAEAALRCLDSILNIHDISKRNFMIENQDVNTLKIVKKFNYATILWVDNIFYWNNKTKADSISVCKIIRNKINELHPDAISSEFSAYPMLCDSFPEQNIHFWDTPKELNEENAEHTRMLCRNKSVKVVLVDYQEAIDY